MIIGEYDDHHRDQAVAEVNLYDDDDDDDDHDDDDHHHHHHLHDVDHDDDGVDQIPGGRKQVD